jgi:hypothetical protein
MIFFSHNGVGISISHRVMVASGNTPVNITNSREASWQTPARKPGPAWRPPSGGGLHLELGGGGFDVDGLSLGPGEYLELAEGAEHEFDAKEASWAGAALVVVVAAGADAPRADARST